MYFCFVIYLLKYHKSLIMKILNTIKVTLVATFLLITSTFFSNNIDLNHSISIEKVKIKLATVDPITPTTGHAGTVVTISGTGFTATSVVTLGTVSIPSANIQFVSSTEIKVTVPCGVTSGYFSVDGVASAILQLLQLQQDLLLIGPIQILQLD